MLKYTLTGFADEISPDLNVQMDVMESLNIHHIEMRGVDGKSLCDYSLEDAAKIKQRLDERGFRLSAIGSPLGKIQITDPFEPHYEFFLHVCDLAKLFETRRIRIFSYYIPDGADPTVYRDEVMRRTEAFVKEAARRGIILQHENEKGIYGETSERCLDLMKQFFGPSFQCNLDPGNFVCCGEDSFPGAYEKLKPYTSYLHIKDAVRVDNRSTIVPAGEGNAHIKDILQDLFRSGYQGFLSLEPHLYSFTGFASLVRSDHAKLEEDKGQGAVLFAKATDALRKILSEIEAERPVL
ncbi:MAG: sugar phosphate isomerase/epimerase [Firmicutes bacterium]|nr:sugar phosphate isomerase/epimerase [Bacillota bacterium]